MDVRCEKCLTIYELDDARVGDAGLTVKCQECGNLFKVRRRTGTAELVLNVPGVAGVPAAPTAAGAADPGGGDTVREIEVPPQAGEGFAASAVDEDAGETQNVITVARRAPARPEERGWMLRSASSGEVVRFRELTTLQQWIVERKVTRLDQISRGGESWKELGGIAELASFFHVVEQAEAVAHASQPGLAMQRSAADAERALPDLPTAVLSRAPTLGPGVLDDGDNTVVEMGSGRPQVPRSNAGALLLGVIVVGGLVAGGAYFLRSRTARTDAPNPAASELLQRGRTALLTDTDDGFREAISALDRALELLDEPAGASASASVLAARADLGEAHVIWAAYLLEDAHRLEASSGTAGGTAGGAAGAQAAHTLRAEAQAHLERARRVLEEGGGANAAAGPLARAFGELLRVEGGPVATAERYLQAAAQKGADDPELAYALGELALREGKAQEAVAHLGEATRGADGGLVRAHYRLAVIARDGDRTDELRRECETLARLAPRHERARTLCAAPTPAATADLGAAPRPADAGTAVTTVAAVTAAPGAAPAAKPVDHTLEPNAPSRPREPGLAPPTDYKSLVREADRLQENGHSKEARKVYERAIELDPRGVAALTGLGYCDLDAERFLQAVDRFNAALAVDPGAGDALVGLAESYKVRGQTQRAIDQYKKYLAAHPDGPKAQMARKNLRDLEPKVQKDSDAKDPDKAEASKERPRDPVLPRPPADEPPPP
jgi:predicted Zn finger-like uncharacterized protein